jgi:hypothetical protein
MIAMTTSNSIKVNPPLRAANLLPDVLAILSFHSS